MYTVPYQLWNLLFVRAGCNDLKRRVTQDIKLGVLRLQYQGTLHEKLLWGPGVSYKIIYVICRCRSVLLAEAEPMLASAPAIPAGVLTSVHRDHVESLEALWSMEDCDDAKAVLEYLQRAVYAHGTSTGLNGVQPCTELIYRASVCFQ